MHINVNQLNLKLKISSEANETCTTDDITEKLKTVLDFLGPWGSHKKRQRQISKEKIYIKYGK